MHAVVDLELDLEAAVGGEEVDVAAQGGVERRRPAGRREREDGEACLLLRGGGSLLQARKDLVLGRARLEHAGVGGHGEEVLRQPVVDLSRHARPLLRHRATELRRADRTPDADEENTVREDPKEVAGRDRAVREERRDDIVQRREEEERRPERDPPVEVAAAVSEPQAEPDHGDQVEQRLKREREREQER